MMERNHGFDDPMGNLGDETVHTRSVLKPYGVWGVISPFNFPFALSGGPAGGALVAGNTVVYKPSSDAPLSGACLLQAMRDAGVPDGVFNMVMGPGRDGRRRAPERTRASTGSSSPARSRSASGCTRASPRSYPKPVIVEMGGKNPAIVSRHADLDEAAEGIMRSAFGFSGQKCSANSRVYVERPVHDELVRLLVEKTEAITIGDPTDRRYWLGPVINARAVARYEQAVSEARAAGRLAIGGERVTENGLDRGLLRRADGRPRPAHGPPPVPRRAVHPVHRGRRGRLDRRGAPPVERHEPRPDRRLLLRGQGRVASASSTRSRPASSTSTGGPAPRPAPGRASSRSAAGRAAPRPARPAAASTTSSSSCASRARRSSTDGQVRRAARRGHVVPPGVDTGRSC